MRRRASFGGTGSRSGEETVVTTPAQGPGPQGPGTEPTPLTPPDPTGLEAWIRQVLGLAGPRASAFTPPLPGGDPGTPPGEDLPGGGVRE
ncbi:hypothetical protein MPTA5024_13145 [Microbispora sp. ATCC PTA-5024]|nr:hypothetical protein MPTA5024_13145 [Microbispora sp. ATCC PTA-5024]